MIACRGRVHREGKVIRVVTNVLGDLPDLLHVGGNQALAIAHGRGDDAMHPAG